MSKLDLKLKELGIDLSGKDRKARKGKGIVAVRKYNDLLYISGHGPTDADNKPVYTGKVGKDLTVEEGYQAARLCGINILSSIADYIGDLDRVDYIVKVLGLVASAPDFFNQPAVMHGFSDLMVEVFGERGLHTRSAMGTNTLPNNIPVEVEVIVKIRD